MRYMHKNQEPLCTLSLSSHDEDVTFVKVHEYDILYHLAKPNIPLGKTG